MLNQIVLVGRIKEIKEDEKSTIMTLIVPQSFKNVNGEYENNYIDVKLFKMLAENTKEYCKIGDMVGVKGRIQKLESDDTLQLIAEKITFLSSTRKEDEE